MYAPTKIEWPEDSPCPLLALVQANGADISQSGCSSIAYQVWQYDDEDDFDSNSNGTEIGASASLTVSSVVFNSRQTDYGWDTNIATGYNLRFTLPKARLPSGDKWYRVEVWITPSSGEEYLGAWFKIHTAHTAKA